MISLLILSLFLHSPELTTMNYRTPQKGNRPNHFHPASAEFCRHQPSHRRCRPHGHGHGHGGHEHEHEHGHGLHGHGDKPPLSVNNLPAGILVNQSTKKERIMNIIQD